MRKKKRNNIIRTNQRKLKWRPWHFVVISGILFLSFIFLFGNHGLIRYYQLKKRKEQLIQQINKLKEEQARLQQEIDLLTNNYQYIEKKAREIYQMGKKGEKIYFMVPPVEESKN